MGHSNIHLITDHKPLERFLENEDVKEEENRRLMNLRRKTENYNFIVSYNPGTTNTADPLSRGERPEGDTFDQKRFPGKKTPQRALLYFASSCEDLEFEGSLAREESKLVEEVNSFLGMLDKSFEEDKINCSCNCASVIDCTVFVFSQDDGEPVMPCECSEERCQETTKNRGPKAEAMMSETGGQMTLREIGEETYEDPILCQLREEVQ